MLSPSLPSVLNAVRSQELMKKMALMTAAPLKTLSTEVKVLPQRMVDNGHTKRALACPQGMVEIPAGDYTFYSNATIIEGRYHRGGGKCPPRNTTCSCISLPFSVDLSLSHTLAGPLKGRLSLIV